MPDAAGPPLRVAIGRDYDIVVAGLRTSLRPYADRVEFHELGRHVPSRLDVLLQDPQLPLGGFQLGDLADLSALVDDGFPRLVGFGWGDHPGYVRRVLAQGAVGYLSKGLPAARLVDALEAIAAGRRVTLDADGAVIPDPGPAPGADALSARESEILTLIAEGLSNTEIGERLYLSINTVKTYIRGAYRKIGVTTRSQAVGWYVGQGLGFDGTDPFGAATVPPGASPRAPGGTVVAALRPARVPPQSAGRPPDVACR